MNLPEVIEVAVVSPTRMEISLSALLHNFETVRSLVGTWRGVFAVIKADAYGHGAVRVAQLYREAGCGSFAVARLGEALELRRAGLSEDILILGQEPEESVGAVVEYDLICACAEVAFARKLNGEALLRKKRARVHLKIDSGMGRLGFLPETLEGVADELFSLPGLEIDGIFTHFAVADEARPDYTNMQFARFEKALACLKRKGLDVRTRHLCNSAGILGHPDKYLDAVRPGIMLYGISPGPGLPDGVTLRPGFSFKSAVVSLHDTTPCSGIGYGLRYITRGRERIAVVPVGYADGWSRSLSGRTSVLIRGRRCPVLGTICMDQMMVDVTDLDDVALGDEVVLIGRQGEAEITVQEIAELRGTIPYEVMTSFSRRVSRVYL